MLQGMRHGLSIILHMTSLSLLKHGADEPPADRMSVRGKTAGNTYGGRRRGRGIHQCSFVKNLLLSVSPASLTAPPAAEKPSLAMTAL